MAATPSTQSTPLRPYWWEAAPRPELPHAALPARADVLIVGSGYTGTSAALTAARGGRSVLVLDRQRAGEGASSLNAGMMSGNLKPSFTALRERYGKAAALALYGEGARARAYLHQLIDDEGIECARVANGRLTAAVTPGHYETLAREAELLRRELGFETHALPRAEQRREIGSELFYGGALNDEIWSFHPGLYHLGLLDAARRAGAVFRTGVEVRRIGRGDGHFEVVTSEGAVAAKDVVVATNGYTTSLGWWRRRVVPVPSQMVASAPIGNNLMRRLLPTGRSVVESVRLFHYARPSPDGTRLLAGGRYGGSGARFERGVGAIVARLGQWFPELGEVEIAQSWYGFTAFSRDFLPHLGAHRGVHYAMGFCGSGTVWGTWLGHKMAERILGGRAEASVFEKPLPAIPLYTGKPWFLAPAMGWFALRDAWDHSRSGR